jgi:hypothetical protein
MAASDLVARLQRFAFNSDSGQYRKVVLLPPSKASAPARTI